MNVEELLHIHRESMMYHSLTPEMKDKWMGALRGGKYKHGINRLRSNKDKFCCLGVLCDVIDDTKWIDTSDTLSNNCLSENWFHGNSKNEIDIRILHGNIQSHLISLNDKNRKSFNDIADWIEENIKPENYRDIQNMRYDDQAKVKQVPTGTFQGVQFPRFDDQPNGPQQTSFVQCVCGSLWKDHLNCGVTCPGNKDG